MNLLHSAVLGAVQGIAEFIPVSSSAHLALFPWLLKWPDQGLAYDVALHWGTILSLLVYFREDLRRLAAAALTNKESKERSLALGLVLATIPGALAGLLAEDYIETVFRKPEYIAASLIGFGILLGAADRYGRKNLSMDALNWRLCLAVGCAQALAVVPGVSRSGITLTAALLLGFRRVDAARFSFLLAVPIVLGAGVFKLKDIPVGGLDAAFWTGIAVSALSGYAAIRFLLGYLKTRDLWIFAFYRGALGFLILFLVNAQPPHNDARQLKLSPPPRTAAADLSPGAARLRGHVAALAGGIGERSVSQPARLIEARDYIARELSSYGYRPELQAYHSKWMGAVKNGTTFYNVIAAAGPEPDARHGLWVLGAHYDTAYRTPGADDNASGVAVLLEIARALREAPPAVPVRLVAYSTEEPPAFDTDNMGSVHHAKELKKEGVRVEGMISLEMLGYYDDRAGSQIYPPFGKWLIPDTGDFIALAANFHSRAFLKTVRQRWKKDARVPLVAAAMPELQTIRLSDNASYWDEGFAALMLTDTASFRTPHYHQLSDTPDTLDYERMLDIQRNLLHVLQSVN